MSARTTLDGSLAGVAGVHTPIGGAIFARGAAAFLLAILVSGAVGVALAAKRPDDAPYDVRQVVHRQAPQRETPSGRWRNTWRENQP
jgi:hypothetical protein